jgi:hypothetical protein
MGGLWGLCDGSTYAVTNSNAGTTNIQTPNMNNGAFLRGGAANGTIANVNPATSPTWANNSRTEFENSHIHAIADQSTSLEDQHFHALQGANATTLMYTAGISSQVVLTSLNTTTANGSPHDHDVPPQNTNNGSPHSHALTNNDAMLNAPSDANNGLPINIGILWWMRR